MKVVLDANIISAVMRGEPQVLSRLQQLQRNEVLLPQPAIAEVLYGLARLPRSKRRIQLVRAFEQLTSTLPRAPWSDDVSERFGTLKAALDARGTRIEDFDVAIAAHALAEGATLITANTRHFSRIPGLDVENWLERH